jgi:small subunit ribosomal protein S3
VDYALAHSFTTYGALGVKVWVYRGMYSAQEQAEYQSTAAGGRARARGRR